MIKTNIIIMQCIKKQKLKIFVLIVCSEKTMNRIVNIKIKINLYIIYINLYIMISVQVGK